MTQPNTPLPACPPACLAPPCLPPDDGRHDRLRYLLASRLAATAGPGRGPASMVAALLTSDGAFAQRFPGYASFAAVILAARAEGGAAGGPSPALACPPLLRRVRGGSDDSSGGGDGPAVAAAGKEAWTAGGGAKRRLRHSAGAAVKRPAAGTPAERAVLERLESAGAENLHGSSGGGSGGAGRGVETGALLSAMTAASGVSRSRAYAVLQRLRSRGAVECARAGGGGPSRLLLWRLPRPGAAGDASPPATPRGIVLSCLERAAAAGGSGGGGGGVDTAALLSEMRAACGIGKDQGYRILRNLKQCGAVECASGGAGAGTRRFVWRLRHAEDQDEAVPATAAAGPARRRCRKAGSGARQEAAP
jgi:hypothetical protein